MFWPSWFCAVSLMGRNACYFCHTLLVALAFSELIQYFWLHYAAVSTKAVGMIDLAFVEMLESVLVLLKVFGRRHRDRSSHWKSGLSVKRMVGWSLMC